MQAFWESLQVTKISYDVSVISQKLLMKTANNLHLIIRQFKHIFSVTQ